MGIDALSLLNGLDDTVVHDKESFWGGFIISWESTKEEKDLDGRSVVLVLEVKGQDANSFFC